jgi:hypothetical protein
MGFLRVCLAVRTVVLALAAVRRLLGGCSIDDSEFVLERPATSLAMNSNPISVDPGRQWRKAALMVRWWCGLGQSHYPVLGSGSGLQSLSMSRGLELVAGRLCYSPGCAASANP